MKRKRPKTTTGITIRKKSGCGYLYTTVNEDSKGPCEVFVTLGKSGGCIGTLTAVIGRLVSLALRSGIGFDDILDDLDGMSCPQTPAGLESCPNCISYGIRKYIEDRRDKHVIRRSEGNTALKQTDDIHSGAIQGYPRLLT